MKLSNIIKSAAAGALMLAAAPAFAAGTASGTSVANQASVDYTVGGVNQPDVLSSIDTFLVDNKVNVVVTEVGGAFTDVAPGSTGQVLTFTVTNTGNTTQDYALAAANTSGFFPGSTDDFDPSAFSVFVESGVTAGYQVAEDTATFINALGADGAATVYIVSSIPLGQANGNTADLTLTATTHDSTSVALDALTGQTAGGDTQGSVDVVFADAAGDTDAARDGAHSDTDAYRIATAVITVNKSSRVISDPFNGTTNPKRIPAAVVEYCIEVVNSGTASATGVVVTDDIAGDPVAFTANAYAVGSSLMNGSSACTANDGTAQSNASDGDNANVTGTVATSNLGTVAAGATARFQFRVTIN